jgi:hypothetical protein
MKTHISSARLLLTLLLGFGTAASGDDSTVVAALKDELSRSIQQLSFPGMERPYYLAYWLKDNVHRSIRATFGALVDDASSRNRQLDVEMRVGSAGLDNSNFFTASGDNSTVQSFGSIPVEDNYAELRRSLWLSTDRTYKKVTDDYTRKKTALKNRRLTVNLPDFLAEPAVTVMDNRLPREVNADSLRPLLRRLSSRFRSQARVQYSEVQFSVDQQRLFYVNSDGTTHISLQPLVSLTVYAGARLPDGTPLQNYRSWYATKVDSLPGEDSLSRAVDHLAALIADLHDAPALQRYVGPVLFEDQAAAELFTRFMVPALCGWRKPVIEDQRYQQYFDGHPLIDKIGGRVLPEHMSVVDDPTIGSVNGRPLLGAGTVDDDGIRARRKELVRDGLLTNLLTARAPVQGIDSVGGNRWGRTVMPSNLIVTTKHGCDEGKLRRELANLVKKRHLAFGILVRRIGNPFFSQWTVDKTASAVSQTSYTPRLRNLIAVYQVFADGSEKLVRCPNLSGLSVESFKYIVAVSRDYHTEDVPVGGNEVVPFGYWGSQLISLSVPSMLFEDVTLKAAEEIPTPWVNPHPFFAEQTAGTGKP